MWRGPRGALCFLVIWSQLAGLGGSEVGAAAWSASGSAAGFGLVGIGFGSRAAGCRRELSGFHLARKVNGWCTLARKLIGFWAVARKLSG